mgnify:CR=1 FL=1
MEPQYKKIDRFYYDPAKPIKNGAFASVFKAYDESRDSMEVAVKVIPSSKLFENDEINSMLIREIEILQQIKGKHIVELIDVRRSPNNLYLFMDYCDGGDLESFMKLVGPMNEDEACELVKKIAEAFVTLQETKIYNQEGKQVTIMHRDIKPANILFHKAELKIADFGFAKLIDEADKDKAKAHTLLGTPLYMAPQILNDETYSAKCDIWSTGVVFYEMLFGTTPWTGASLRKLYQNIISTPIEFHRNLSEETKDLIRKMLTISDEERITWKEVYNHPALNKNTKK